MLSLSTQVLGNVSEFQRAVKLVIDNVSFDKDSTVQVFEANIRFLSSCWFQSHTRKQVLDSPVISVIMSEWYSHPPHPLFFSICFHVELLNGVCALSKGYWEVLSLLTFCSRTQNILLARWALKVTITSCSTWPTTWLSAYCPRSRTRAQAFLTQGWVGLVWMKLERLQKFQFGCENVS